MNVKEFCFFFVTREMAQYFYVIEFSKRVWGTPHGRYDGKRGGGGGNNVMQLCQKHVST